MNGAQIHLGINHLPLVGLLYGVGILIVGRLFKNSAVTRTGLGLMAFAAALAIPVYLSGEGAEETIEHLPGVGKNWIERHEDAAKLALVLSALTLIPALGALWGAFKNRVSLERLLTRVTLVFGLAALILLARASHQGGEIRHDELRSGAAKVSDSVSGHSD